MKIFNREIPALAVPSIIANITTPLLGLVDTAVTGHLDSSIYLAAIAVGSSMFNLLYWLFGFLRMGSSGMTAIATGRGDSHSQAMILYRGLLVASSIALLMIVLSPMLCDLLIHFLKPEADTAAMASRYFSIVIWGAPAVLCSYVLCGWFLGMQSSKRPMIISIAINTINIAVSPVLAFTLDMKLDGVATGTLIAQWTGFIIGLVMVVRYKPERVKLRRLIDTRELKHYFRINSDIMLRTACLIAVTLYFTREGARQGDSILAANALLMQLFTLFSYTIDGFAFAAEALIGRHTGNRDYTTRRQCVISLMTWGVILAIAYSLVYLIAGNSIIKLLTDYDSVLATAYHYIPWAVAIPLASFAAFIWDGIYIGCTATRHMLTAMAIAMVTFFVAYHVLKEGMGNHALWAAFILYLATRSIVQTIMWRRYTKSPNHI